MKFQVLFAVVLAVASVSAKPMRIINFPPVLTVNAATGDGALSGNALDVANGRLLSANEGLVYGNIDGLTGGAVGTENALATAYLLNGRGTLLSDDAVASLYGNKVLTGEILSHDNLLKVDLLNQTVINIPN